MKLLLSLTLVLFSFRVAIAEEATSLTVVDEANKPYTVTAIEISKLPRVKAKVKIHEADAAYEGALLSDVLKSIGVRFGEELKGKRAATVVVLEAADNYRTALALLEIDSNTTDKQVILADRRDGKPLSATEGPYRLVIPDEKRQVRWIRMLRKIRVVNLKDFPLDADNHKQK